MWPVHHDEPYAGRGPSEDLRGHGQQRTQFGPPSRHIQANRFEPVQMAMLINAAEYLVGSSAMRLRSQKALRSRTWDQPNRLSWRGESPLSPRASNPAQGHGDAADSAVGCCASALKLLPRVMGAMRFDDRSSLGVSQRLGNLAYDKLRQFSGSGSRIVPGAARWETFQKVYWWAGATCRSGGKRHGDGICVRQM